MQEAGMVKVLNYYDLNAAVTKKVGDPHAQLW
jgi:hypothetical protein